MRNLAKILLIAGLISLANASSENECNGGKASACFSAAKEFDSQGDTDKAIEFYKKSCELNYALGCNKVGEKYLELKNNEYAKMFFSKACALNHHESCVSYGEIFEDEGNCDMASEIYKDTFKNKKFKPAQDKFEALVGNEKCMSEDLKRQKVQSEMATAPIDNPQTQLDQRNLGTQATNTAAVLQKIFNRDILEKNIEHLEQFTGMSKRDYNLPKSKILKSYVIGNERCTVEAIVRYGKILSVGLVPNERCTFDLFAMTESFDHISANQLTIGYLFDKFGANKIAYESSAGCGVMKSPQTPFDFIYTAAPAPNRKIEFKASMDDAGGAERILNCYSLTFGEDFFLGIGALMFNQKYNDIVYKKLQHKRPFKIEVGYDLMESSF